MKEILSGIAVALTFIAYIPYFRDILKGKTHPHIYSWALWEILTVLIVALQIKGGAGSATYVTVAAGMMCLGVIILSLKSGKRYITRMDTTVAILALLAIAFWLIVDQPVISLVLAITADMLAFIPTVRKSWHHPRTETLSLYITNAIRFALATLAVEKFTFLSAAWLVVWAAGNGLFAIMLVIRRKQIA